MSNSENTNFQSTQYLLNYPDVAAAILAGAIPTAETHFDEYGIAEDRNDGSFVGTFNDILYLQDNPDVLKAVLAGEFTNGYQHYLEYGQAEGRPAYNMAGAEINRLGEPTYTLSAPNVDGVPSPVDDGNSVTISLATTKVQPGTVVNYTITGIDASEIAGGSLTGTLTVAAGGTASIPLTLLADTTVKADETMTVTLDDEPTATATVTVHDTFTPTTSAFTLSESAASVAEGNTVTFTVTADAPVAATTTFIYSAVGNTLGGVAVAAIAGTGFTPASGTITIAAGQTTGTATLTLPNTGGVSLEGLKFSLLNSVDLSLIGSTTLAITQGTPLSTGTTFSLTPGVDTGAAFTGTGSANDTFDATLGSGATLNSFDSLTGGSGTNTLQIVGSTTNGDLLPAAVTLANIQNVALSTTTNAGASAGNPFNVSGFSGVTNLTVASLLAGGDFLKASATQNVTDTAAGAVTTLGGDNVTITNVGNETVGGTTPTNPTGIVGLADTALGAGTVSVSGGTTIGAVLSGVTTGGSIALGSSTTSGAITATVSDANITDAGTVLGSTVATTGGTTVNITQNIVAPASGLGANISTGGAVTVTGTAATTAVTVTQTAPVTPVTGVAFNAGSAGTPATDSIAFADLLTNQSLTINGFTITSGSGTILAAHLAAVFAAQGGVGNTTTADNVAVSDSTGTITSGAWGGGYTATYTASSTSATFTAPTVGVGTPFAPTGNGASSAVITPTPGTPFVAPATAVTGVGGIADGAVTINDVNGTSPTAAGKITSVSLSNYAASTLTDNALATLTLAGIGGLLTINDDLTTPTATTLALAANGLTGAITDTSHEITTLNVTTGGATASTLTGLIDTGLTTLNVAGTKGLAVTTAAPLTSVTVSGGAGLTIALGTTTTFTSTSTGTDVVTIAAATTKTITGNGTAGEELVWNGASAPGSSASFGTVSGFKTLGIGGSVTSGVFDMSAITGFSGFDVQADTASRTSDTISIIKAIAGSPLAIDGTFTGTLSYNTADTAGATDSLALTLGTAATTIGATTTALTVGDSATHGIGTLNVTSNASAMGTNTITTLTDNNLSTLTIAGTGALAIGNSVADTSTSLAITNNSSATIVSTLLGVTDAALTTVSFGGTGQTTLGTLTNSASTSLAVTDSDAAAVVITTLAETTLTSATFTNSVSSTAGTFTLTNAATEAALAALTLNGSVAASFTGDTVTTGITVSGATDNAAVSFSSAGGATASGKADSVTLGNGIDTVALGAGVAGAGPATSTQTVVLGTGAGDSVSTLSVGTVNITEGSHATGTDIATASGTGVAATVTMGNGTNTITANGVGDTLVINAGNGANTISATGSGDTANIAVGTGTSSIAVGSGANTVTLGTHSVTTSDNVSVAATTTGSFVPTAVITGLNSGGTDTITFSSDSSATGAITPYTTAAVNSLGAALGTGSPTTLAGTINDILSGGALARHGIAEFQFGSNTYFVEQAGSAGNAFGVGDTLVELAGTPTFTSLTTASGAGILHLHG